MGEQLDTNFKKWRKSTRSQGNTQSSCVRMGESTNAVGIQDTKDPLGRTLVFTPRVWERFLLAVENDEFGEPDQG
ncbi:hypothetical protein GCM10010174_03660 [Kutzneria viridogrisea]|uniref:DUF397 domain-containing protein n=1 Tax=Kutzneria viridogrisea TaxID=47990 RepID=A0ABR6BRC2_9PSEU|nr:hypothetical protein [Kutzneria viridogrisea]